MIEFYDGKYICEESGETVDPLHLPTIGETPFPTETEETIQKIVECVEGKSIPKVTDIESVEWAEKRERLHISLGSTSVENNLLSDTGNRILLKIDVDLIAGEGPGRNLNEISISGSSVLFDEIIAHAPNGSWVAQHQPVPVYIRDPYRKNREYIIDNTRERWIDPFRIQFVKSKWIGLDWKNGNIGIDNTGTARLTNYGTVTESY